MANEQTKLNVVEQSFNSIDVDNATAIAYLEDALATARNEKVVCCVVIMQHADQSLTTGWSACESARPYALLGALTEVAHRYAEYNISHE